MTHVECSFCQAEIPSHTYYWSVTGHTYHEAVCVWNGCQDCMGSTRKEDPFECLFCKEVIVPESDPWSLELLLETHDRGVLSGEKTLRIGSVCRHCCENWRNLQRVVPKKLELSNERICGCCGVGRFLEESYTCRVCKVRVCEPCAAFPECECEYHEAKDCSAVPLCETCHRKPYYGEPNLFERGEG